MQGFTKRHWIGTVGVVTVMVLAAAGCWAAIQVGVLRVWALGVRLKKKSIINKNSVGIKKYYKKLVKLLIPETLPIRGIFLYPRVASMLVQMLKIYWANSVAFLSNILLCGFNNYEILLLYIPVRL